MTDDARRRGQHIHDVIGSLGRAPRGFMSQDDLLAFYMRDFDPLADDAIDAEAVEEVPTRSTYDCKVDGHVWLLGADRCHVCQTPRVNPGSSQ